MFRQKLLAIRSAIIDHNGLQITGRTRDVCNSDPLDEKSSAFGWSVTTVDGHDFEQLSEALSRSPESGKPTVVIANTTKGKGVSFMEDVVRWHQHRYRGARRQF